MSVRRAAIDDLVEFGEIDVILARLDEECWEMKLAAVRAIFTFAWWQGLISAEKSPIVELVPAWEAGPLEDCECEVRISCGYLDGWTFPRLRWDLSDSHGPSKTDLLRWLVETLGAPAARANRRPSGCASLGDVTVVELRKLLGVMEPPRPEKRERCEEDCITAPVKRPKR